MISVIISVYNEREVLEKCIESLGTQTYADFEIIVVDDGSTDGTLQILENLNKAIRGFKFLKQSHSGPGAARNLGAKEAKGEVLVFVDADMTFDKNFLKKLIEPIVNKEVKGTFSKEEYVSNWENPWARCWSINQGWEEKRRHPANYPDVQPVFRAVIKTEFNKVNGFTPGGYDDDWSLSKKLGYDAVNAPGAIFYHKNPSTLSEVLKHSQWVGKRKYKLGIIGELIGMARASFPASIFIGTYKSILKSESLFLPFKIVYDWGIFTGILEHLLTGKSSK